MKKKRRGLVRRPPTMWWPFFYLHVLAVVMVVVMAVLAPVVPALFVFGNSLTDVAKANHPSYGLTYLDYLPIGHFVDGFNTFDYFDNH